MAFVAVHGTDKLEGFEEDEEDTVGEITSHVEAELFDKIHGGVGGADEATAQRTQTRETTPPVRRPNLFDTDEFEGAHEKGEWS